MSQKLFVYGVSEHCSYEVIEGEFRTCGNVEDIFNTGKGYAFVTMSDIEGADKAVAELNGIEIDGQAIKVSLNHTFLAVLKADLQTFSMQNFKTVFDTKNNIFAFSGKCHK